MHVIVCLDDKNGMMFNCRRQSSDRVLRQYVIKLVNGSALWMNVYSAKQFLPEAPKNICVSEDFLNKAQKGEWCFVENKDLRPFEKDIEDILVCRWNRVYPADMFFDISLKDHGWVCKETKEIVGSSHEKITMEIYQNVR